MQIVAGSVQDAALGCLLGACVGDAAGATLEFIGRTPTSQEVAQAITMPGGGILKVAPGQITDDGELTLCLTQALSVSKTFSPERVAQKYVEWVQSNPFDMGYTTRNSLGCFLDPEWGTVCTRDGYASGMTQAAFKRCMGSKANGSLMRASPLGIWGYKLKAEELALFAKEDSSLSHPNESCIYAVACYAIAIAHLVKALGEREPAFERAKQWAEVNANEEVCGWMEDAENNIDIAYHPQIGFVKIGFTHAFRHLLLGSNYVEAIRETLSGGGDTDTNACIVGGLIGAACGAESIPDEMKMPVLNCDTRKGQQPRPEFLHTNKIPELADKLLANAPD